jgi:hypothetical protein
MALFASYIAERSMGSLRRLICALRGHESYRHFDKNRVYLQCIGCGHESPGWTVEVQRPVLRFQSKRERTPIHAVMRKIA